MKKPFDAKIRLLPGWWAFPGGKHQALKSLKLREMICINNRVNHREKDCIVCKFGSVFEGDTSQTGW
jgi:hypothetical protein